MTAAAFVHSWEQKRKFAKTSESTGKSARFENVQENASIVDKVWQSLLKSMTECVNRSGSVPKLTLVCAKTCEMCA
jgi:hypothetical protein